MYAEGDASNVARWIAFQFTPTIATEHLGRSDLSAIERCAPIARQLLKTGKLTKLESAIAELQRDNTIRPPRLYEHLVGRSHIPSFHHLCIAYAISVSLRGYSYAIALGQHPNAPLYCHHWVRSPIVRRIGSHDVPAEVEHQSMVVFPWGEILQRVFDTAEPLSDRSPDHVAQVLDGIRDRSARVRDAIQAGLLDGLVEKVASNRITDAEDFIVRLLLEVGVSPGYAKSNFLQRAVALLRGISKQSIAFKIPVDLITANLQPNWLRRPESIMRMRFKRDSFWKVMEDPGIRKALSAIRAVNSKE